MGYRHGPKLLFGKDDDGHYSISHVEFYSAKEHKKLMQSIKIEKDNLQKENFLEKEAK